MKFSLSFSLSLIIPSFPPSLYFPKKIAHCRQSRSFIYVYPTIVQYREWTVSFSLRSDDTYNYFHFFIAYLSISLLFFLFYYYFVIIQLIFLSLSSKEGFVLRCTSCTLRMLIILSYDYSYMRFNIFFNCGSFAWNIN